jgi:alkanesulfonate monooxygenase SsuD/methylene tetrahydromethanopterin reductase-like flavin-dependent oxidoreductase (luciferase family)
VSPEALIREETRVVVGDPERVRTRLHELAEHYAVDEIMTVTVTHDFAARRRSYQLLAEVMELEGFVSTATEGRGS